ncbi:MAG: macro domain-containing protein [Chitinophagaceae bacterium]|nr:macro domain-containing protein [Anaerolineae bacterium]
MKAKINKVTLQLTQGDILALSTDALVIVTDPNISISEKLASKAGAIVQEQAAQIGWSDVGTAVMTDAGDLSGVQKLIHAVAPRWGEGSERGKLANTTWACLSLAEENGLQSLALPAISAGTLGYPLENCATTMLTKIIDYTFEDIESLRTIILCLEDEAAYEIFRVELLHQLHELKETG